ncbi:MAG TPA: Dabb family protein [Symbiobacteriaceae bacterium]|nr:Dabb family protein [Symbiobacteriaceae bacterium]
MVEHIVCIKLKPGTTAAIETEIIEGLKALKESVPVVVDLSVGKDFTITRNQGYTIGLVVRLRSKADLLIYNDHPNHLPIKKRIGELAETVMAIDYEF